MMSEKNLYSHDDPANKEIIIFKGIVTYENKEFESQREYIERYIHMNFINIILANMVQHPQYAGISLSKEKLDSYESIDVSD
jgi:hypothetical protein